MIPLFENKSHLPAISDNIVASYAEDTATHHLDHCPLPRHDAVVDVINDLKEIIYPGYQKRERLHSSNVIYYVGSIVDRLHDHLVILFERAICHSSGNSNVCSPERQPEIERTAQQKTMAFLNQIPDIRRKLAKDVQAAYAGDPACKSLGEVILCYPGLEAITVYRLAHALYELQIPLIPRMMSEWAHSGTGIDIHPGARIGDYFFIDHGTGVVVGETTIIGDWVKIYQGVTLGAASFPKDETGDLIRTSKRHPTLEDNVVVYANATILGGKTVIGKGSVIGSSVWLTHSIQPGTTVMIEHPSLKIRTSDSERFDWQI
ncbi:serine acetyltransferase [Planctomycetales bacterium]|nr:serine acetyltransferase [Planctomycetales bacterium]GHT46002.1 serine acetyltransferase [Planctomycetales bacterium]